MTTPTKIVVDCTTGEQHIIDLTAEEITQLEADRAAAATAKAAQDAADAAKASAKASAETKLKALGLTTAEVAALLS